MLVNRAQVIAEINATSRLRIYSYPPLGTEPTGEARFTMKLRHRSSGYTPCAGEICWLA